MSDNKNGIILRCIGGFYYVETADAVYECRARGSFRRQGVTPVAGDRVTITLQPDGKGVLEQVLDRKNCLIRPAVANLDLLVIVASVREPDTNTFVLDRMIAIAESNGICPIIVISKSDLGPVENLESVYRKAGLECYAVSVHDPSSLEPLRNRLSGKVCAFTGNSGVGKSSILNALDPSLQLETAEISQKLGRGRHTTRVASLYPMMGGYLVDTPGFTALETERVLPIRKDELADCFREFAPYVGRCRFIGCAHYKEPDCAVRAAVKAGEIPASRYAGYVSIYEAIKDQKEWEKN